jgi:hypothetical protein
MDWSTMIKEFGFAGLVFGAFMFLLKWVLNQQTQILKQSDEQNTRWQKVICEHTERADISRQQLLSQTICIADRQDKDHRAFADQQSRICNELAGLSARIDK